MVKKYGLEAEIWKKSCFELFFLEWLYSKSGNIVHQRASVGMCGMCAGVCGCALVCAGMRRCTWLCADVHGCVQVCASVRVCAGVDGYVWVCAGVRRCVRVCTGVCVDMHGYTHVCGMNFQNFFWRIESLHQRTLIRILYEFLHCFITVGMQCQYEAGKYFARS